MSEFRRYAVFYMPAADNALAGFGAEWLGWDAHRGAAQSPDNPPPGWNRVTKTPRKYGFHGTLKAPFALAEDTDLPELRAAVGAVAGAHEAFDCAALALASFGRLFALVPSAPSDALDALAGACVTRLDRFRAPMTEAERERRRARGLTAQQDAHLTRWGYPYVLEDFRFHMTLTGAVPEQMRAAIEADLTRRTALFRTEPLAIDALTLCGEAVADGRFRVIERFPLRGR